MEQYYDDILKCYVVLMHAHLLLLYSTQPGVDMVLLLLEFGRVDLFVLEVVLCKVW